MLRIVINGKKWLEWASLVCQKVKYGHEPTALKAAEAMHRKTGDSYDAYHCETCNAWHIGHAR